MLRILRFRELFEQDEVYPSLRDFIASHAQPHEAEIAAYLGSAPALSGVGTIARDVINPAAQIVLVPGERTDGVYVWPNELSYYVRTYHLRIPHDFVERMASRNWNPPTFEEIDWKIFDLEPPSSNP